MEVDKALYQGNLYATVWILELGYCLGAEARDGTDARSFKELVHKRIASDPAFGEALLHEGNTMLAGDVDIGKAILRDYIKATVGFAKPGAGLAPRSCESSVLDRRFLPRGSPATS